MAPASYYTWSLLVLCFVVNNSYANSRSKTTHYEWEFAATVGGFQNVTQHDTNHIDVSMSYRDRGRGPDIDARYDLDATGNIVKFHATGHSDLGAEINEHFEIAGDVAVWQSTSEQGRTRQFRNKFYLPNTYVPQTYAVLARYLLSKPSLSAETLPAGSAELKIITRLQLQNNDERKQVVLYAIYGISIDPMYVWLDENQELFGIGMGWDGLTLAGWLKDLKTLQNLQDQATNKYFRKLTKQASRALPNTYTITNVAIFDAKQAKRIPNQRVTVKHGRIFSVTPETNRVVTGELIDGTGHTLLPGLWDMHGHITDANSGVLNISSGITSTRDMGNNHEFLMTMKKEFDSNSIAGPNIYPAGFIDKRGPYTAPVGIVVNTLAEALKTVVWYSENGYRMIKIYSSIEPEWVAPIAAEAHSRGMRVAGHIPSFMRASQGVEAGMDEITHMNMLFLNFLADKKLDTRTSDRITFLADKARLLDVHSDKVQQFLQVLKDKKIVVDTTLTIFETFYTQMPGNISPIFTEVEEHLPIDMQRYWRKGRIRIKPNQQQAYRESFETMLRMTKELYDSGIGIVPGTDMIEGFGYIRELQLYAQAGIPINKVLQLATIGSAAVAGVDGETGSISIGKKAEFILIPGNPLESIAELYRVNRVVKGNTMYYPDKLQQAIGIKPFS